MAAERGKAGEREAGAGAVLERLGARIRARRQALALTIRELAVRSGVSERFLALMEGGTANVSVVRLYAVAEALGTTASELLLEPGAGAGAGTGAAAKGPLVALLGLRGAGKTAIGGRAAARLGLPFIELDARIAERAGMSLEAIFELHGSAYFRRMEREVLEGLIREGTPAIVATGGGLVTDHANFELLQRAAVTVWLRAAPEDHWNRVVAQGDVRPMENRADAMEELRRLLGARRALYELAEYEVDTSSLGLSRSVDRVVKLARDVCSRYSPPSA